MIPLTLDQIVTIPKAIVYLEYRNHEYSSGYRQASWVMAWLGHPSGSNRAMYGKTWRCWIAKPTEAERQIAEWKEDTNEAD